MDLYLYLVEVIKILELLVFMMFFISIRYFIYARHFVKFFIMIIKSSVYYQAICNSYEFIILQIINYTKVHHINKNTPKFFLLILNQLLKYKYY